MPPLQLCPHCGVCSTKPTAKFCAHCGQALPASIQSVGADQPLLHTILAEIQSLRGEIVALRNALTDQAQQRITPPQMPTLAASAEPPAITESSATTPQRLLEWLAARKISVKEQRQPEAADSVFDELALFLGERFQTLHRLHDTIRKHLGSGTSFSLSMSNRSQEEIANTTQFCKLLSDYAFLTAFKYNRDTKTIYATPQRDGKVINFFTGGWFERFVMLKIQALIAEYNGSTVWLNNPKIVLPNGDDFELDLLFLVDQQPLWIECKTGDYQAYIGKYVQMRKLLGIAPEHALLAILGISDDLAQKLSSVYPITVINQTQLLSAAQRGLSSPAQPAPPPTDAAPPAAPPAPPNGVSATRLATLLNKVNLRPFPEYRSQVIAELLVLLEDRAVSEHTEQNLAAVKHILADRLAARGLPISKNQLQDLLNVLIRGGCLRNAAGEQVYSFTQPVSQLITNDVGAINARCAAIYLEAILAAEPTFLEQPNHAAVFAHVVGVALPAPTHA